MSAHDEHDPVTSHSEPAQNQQAGFADTTHSKTPRALRNVVASVNARLLTVSRQRHEEFQLTLMRYGLERLLYRLGASAYAGQFVVKGALLFSLWAWQEEQAERHALDAPPSASHSALLSLPHRATHDLDLLGFGAHDVAQLAAVFRSLCQVPVELDDGLVFQADTVQAAPIREDQEYGGVRVHLLALLGKARLPLQIDIGFGDVVTPAPLAVAFPTLLDLPAPQVRVYPRETVVAEKFEALVRLGKANTRFKDFYDLWTLAKRFPFAGETLAEAIRATFARRQTPLPQEAPLALTEAFVGDSVKQMQWQAFQRKAKLDAETFTLEEVVIVLRDLLLPPTGALAGGGVFLLNWEPGGPWR